MCCERLMCAACSGHVVDARCPVCAAAKARMHTGGTAALHVPEWLAVAVVAVLTLTMLLAVYSR